MNSVAQDQEFDKPVTSATRSSVFDARTVVGLAVAGTAMAGVLLLALLDLAQATQRQWIVVLALLGIAGGALAVHAVVRNALAPLREATARARVIAKGHLSAPATGAGIKHPVLDALEELRERTFGVVADVRARTLAIATSSGHVGADHKAFSSAVRSQSQSLESTASSLEEVTAVVQHNAENAARAHELAVSTLAVAAQGGQVVQEVVQTMGTIRASSDKIVDIIAVIDGIAFQTNILALNAAVEAARAGEQGRGFAVVAGEVRALATRSAEAARAVKALIDDSVTAVVSGSRLVEGAGETMQQIVDSVQNVTTIMTEMSAAAREQSAGVAEINRAIIEVDAATQRNVALFERANEPLQALHAQALALTEAVQSFTLGAREFGSDEEAKALVQRGARYLQAHGAQAFLDEVNKRDQGQLIDRDLYLSVYSMEHICKAHGINQRLVDADVTDFQDLDGRRIVADIVAIARRDGAGHITYRWENPLTRQPMSKSTHFERHGDLVLSCGAHS